ncbi:MAG: hypothetical protein LBV18_03470 [Alistipes sp.]|jgi:hypothetical protein|nr:hypothetical protein [Alistipes sp.]
MKLLFYPAAMCFAALVAFASCDGNDDPVQPETENPEEPEKEDPEEPESLFVDELVGEWNSKGFYMREFTPSPDSHTVTIEKVDDRTVRIIDMMGLATRFSADMTSAQDTFTASVDNDNRTISIVPQPIEPTFDPDGWPVYVCRFLNDMGLQGSPADNWMTGFENIAVSDSDSVSASSEGLTVDFGSGGFYVGNFAGPAYGSFVPLTKDPNGDTVYSYNWYFANTVWTKN